jgi:hypothetical protein
MWECRERDRQFDAKWADSLLPIFSCVTVEEFWEAWYHVPTIRCGSSECCVSLCPARMLTHCPTTSSLPAQ